MNEIRKLERQIHESIGVTDAEEHGSDVWLRIVGPPQDMPEVAMSLVTALLEAFRKAVQAIVGLASAGEPTTRPAEALERACDLRITVFRLVGPGIGLRVPDPGDYDWREHEEPILVRRALGRLLQVADWAGSDAPPEALESLRPDPRERRVILEARGSLLPPPGGDIERLEVSGKLAPEGRTISLTRESHRRIEQAIDALAVDHVEVGGSRDGARSYTRVRTDSL